jgi:hypothetical protein
MSSHCPNSFFTLRLQTSISGFRFHEAGKYLTRWVTENIIDDNDHSVHEYNRLNDKE